MNLSRENEETLSIDFEGVMVPLYDFVQAVVVSRPISTVIIVSDMLRVYEHYAGTEPQSSPNYE